jgi:hypothetical protein
MPQEEKLEVGNTEANFYWFTQRPVIKNAVFALTPDAVNSLTCHGHRAMIEKSGVMVKVCYQIKNMMLVPK